MFTKGSFSRLLVFVCLLQIFWSNSSIPKAGLNFAQTGGRKMENVSPLDQLGQKLKIAQILDTQEIRRLQKYLKFHVGKMQLRAVKIEIIQDIKSQSNGEVAFREKYENLFIHHAISEYLIRHYMTENRNVVETLQKFFQQKATTDKSLNIEEDPLTLALKLKIFKKYFANQATCQKKLDAEYKKISNHLSQSKIPTPSLEEFKDSIK